MNNILVIDAFALAALIWWVVVPLFAVVHERALRVLSAQTCVEPERWPRVSVLVPANNEAQTLTGAVQSLLEIDYPELEIILIDDRSTDRTGEVMDRLAEQDARIRKLRIDLLPDGWLGKVHALYRGIERSRGEWLLFTDADIHFAPRALKLAVAYCLQRERGFLALFPGSRTADLVNGATQAAFGVLLLAMLDFERISDSDNDAAMGVGAFNLVQREFIDAENGLEWLRMEVADDAGLALMTKRRGARIEVMAGQDLVEVDWYPTLGAMLDGVMQRFIMGAGYRLGVYLVQCLLVLFCLAAPLGLVWFGSAYTPWALLCLAFYATPSLLLATGIRKLALSRSSLWSLPLGFTMIAYGMLRSLVTCARRGGMVWRGTVYPLRQLRALQRVKMPGFF